VQVTLATGIPKEHCTLVNLSYRDPETVDARDYAGDPRTLVIPRAGEMLYRLAPNTPPSSTTNHEPSTSRR
jgi:hypothetical protein